MDVRRHRWARGRVLQGLAPLTVGLAITATVMAGACTWQAREASRSSVDAANEMALSQAYQDINSAANREYSAQLRHLSGDHRSDTVASTQLAQFSQAQTDLRAAVERVDTLGSVDDKVLAAYVRVEDRQYGQNARTVFAAAEAGQIAEARHLATTITGPRVDKLISVVASAAATHDRRSRRSMARLTERSRWAASAIPSSFGVALLLLGGCWVILLQLNKAVRFQASALLAEKQLLSTVIESSPYFVYWKDTQGRYLGSNRAFELLRTAADTMGVGGGTASPGASVDAGNGALIRRLIEIEEQVQAGGVAVIDQQASVSSADGEERRLLFSVLPRQADSGQEGIVGVGVDVTRLTDLERHLATASRLESVGRLAAGLAHEINTPVQVMSSNTAFVSDATKEILAGFDVMHEMCRAGELDASSICAVIDSLDMAFLQEEIPVALADTRAGLRRVTSIVQAMTDFAGGGQGFGLCRLNEAVQSVVEISRHEWASVAELRLQLDPELTTLTCHEGEVKESLVALLINAAQAVAEKQEKVPGTPQGVIELTTQALPDGARIIVRDNGIGMDDGVRQKIFDPFFTTKVVGRGAGQGLNFAYRAIVTHHGGTIEVSSALGEGSTFTITLPAHALTAAPDAAMGTPSPLLS
jgi:two-component system NtrC family sensor kinase